VVMEELSSVKNESAPMPPVTISRPLMLVS
jgi:hypothetical protein